MKLVGEANPARRREMLCRAGILVISQNAAPAHSLRETLVRAAHERVELVTDLSTVIRRLRDFEPDLIILDWTIPGLSGSELWQALQSETAAKGGLPILAMTAPLSPKMKSEALQAGAADVLEESSDAAEINSRVDNLLETRFLQLALGRLLSEQKRIEQELSKTREEAEQSGAAKSEFLSRMSHELRTPLNAIIGFAQLADLDARTPDEHENVEQILRASSHLLHLINEVLDISRIEAATAPLFLRPVSIQLAAKEAFALLRPSAAEKGIHLDQSGCNYYVNADAQRVQQVMLNLFSNAIKYNKPGGGVALACRETDHDMLRIEVRDTGVGIAKYDLARLFQPFQRLAPETEGIGLGLVICQRLVRSMGGTMDVESKRGVGSTFWFELPLARSMPAEDAPSAHAASRRQDSFAAETRTVLCIEDNLPNLKLVERILSQRDGIRMISAQQGSLGLELARQHQPDLILLDLHLPDMNGDQVLIWLRSEPRTTKIPVIVISADALGGEIERLKNLGARAYVTKPFEVQHFLRVVDETLAAPLSSPI